MRDVLVDKGGGDHARASAGEAVIEGMQKLDQPGPSHLRQLQAGRQWAAGATTQVAEETPDGLEAQIGYIVERQNHGEALAVVAIRPP
jgi:hypothetical protein